MNALTKTNAINWFEIYVSDFDRARRFYQTILDEPLTETDMPGGKMAMFAFDQQQGIGGALVQAPESCSTEGGASSGLCRTMVYLNVDGKIDAVLARVPGAGGKVIRDRMPIPPHGFIAFFQDPEGNNVGLHSLS